MNRLNLMMMMMMVVVAVVMVNVEKYLRSLSSCQGRKVGKVSETRIVRDQGLAI